MRIARRGDCNKILRALRYRDTHYRLWLSGCRHDVHWGQGTPPKAEPLNIWGRASVAGGRPDYFHRP